MRLKFIILVVLMLFTVYGCGTLRHWNTEFSSEMTTNIENIKVTTEEFLDRWPVESGIIRGYFNNDLTDLPADFEIVMDELDLLSEKYKNGEITDKDIGYAFGYRLKLLSDSIRRTIEVIAPDILDLITLF